VLELFSGPTSDREDHQATLAPTSPRKRRLGPVYQSTAHVRTRDQAAEYLRARSEEDGDCWIWTRAVNGAGVPVARVNGKNGTTVRRWAWGFISPVPPGNRVVTVRCGTPLCVCIDHLTVKTKSQVLTKSWQAGNINRLTWSLRRAQAFQARSKLTWDDIARIRERRASGEILRTIAADYGLNNSTISKIALGKAWTGLASNPFAQLIIR
jgi:hypothetical protein